MDINIVIITLQVVKIIKSLSLNEKTFKTRILNTMFLYCVENLKLNSILRFSENILICV